ncbi:MAG TPA: di-heme-cytochrome C peroxidase, partial [Thermoanaerobaculia bacterium]
MRKLAMLLALLALALSASAATPQWLDQNWTDVDRQWFYVTPQGSKLIPFNWAQALERADSETLFLSDLTHLGYLPNAKSPDGLPVGFVRDTALGTEHLGMTCAACHTNQVDYRGTTFQIDGAPTDADLFGLLAELGEAVSATAADAASPKFQRFAKRVLGSGNGPKARAKLYAQLVAYNRYFTDFVTATTPATPWGRSRADAFGAIFNRVTAIDLNVPDNNRPPDAPVSYPFLWDASWHDVVQWNGSAPNQLAVLRLARNVGEVLGVFAQIKLRKPTLLHAYYESSAKRVQLLEIEDRLAKLRSPKWPAAFPAIDRTKAAAGEKLYAQHCLSCHAIATPGVRQDVVMTDLSEIQTDPAMVRRAADFDSATGVLEGVKEFVVAGRRFNARENRGTITFNAVIGAILSPIPADWFRSSPLPTQTKSASTAIRSGEGSENDLRNDLLSKAHARGGEKSPVNQDLMSALDEISEARTKAPTAAYRYKARPLDGIWATAPYLHNGSVPTLRDLLLPPAQRPKTFYVGSREFDPVNVGFETTPGPRRFLFDT